MTLKMNTLRKCEDFLNQVVSKHPDQYTDINDLLQRHRNLQNSISMLRQNKENIEQENDLIKNEYSKIEKDKTDEILFLNIEISNL